MKNWFNKISRNMQTWMQGRYGNDELNTAMYILSLLLLILSGVSSLHFLFIPSAALILWTCFRVYSKNIYKRSSELEKFLRITGGIRSWFRLQREKWHDRKDYRYFRCKQCRTVLRVPKGKGSIRIHCPKCHGEIQAKT